MSKNDKHNNKTIFANWKMHFTESEAISFCKNLSQAITKQPDIAEKLVLAPPLIYISLINHLFPNITLAAQDVSCSPKNYGAFTGEVSAHMLASANVRYIIIGHFERRKYHNETACIINTKINNALANNIIPIVCFGEESIHDNPLQELIKVKQYSEQPIIYAYEPYWAIGNKNFQPEQISRNLIILEQYLKNDQYAKYHTLIYGGSVNSQNINQLKDMKILDGILIGGASLDLDELLKILQILTILN